MAKTSETSSMNLSFEIGKSYKYKDQSVNQKVYHCKKSHDGHIRLYYDHKGTVFSICVSPGFASGLDPMDFYEIVLQ